VGHFEPLGKIFGGDDEFNILPHCAVNVHMEGFENILPDKLLQIFRELFFREYRMKTFVVLVERPFDDSMDILNMRKPFFPVCGFEVINVLSTVEGSP
jgi:hypothetical protein